MRTAAGSLSLIHISCEIFLPLSSTVEHATVVYTHSGASPIMAGAVNKSITVGDCKGDCEIFYELGLRCMPINFEKYKDYYDFLADYRLAYKKSFEEMCIRDRSTYAGTRSASWSRS